MSATATPEKLMALEWLMINVLKDTFRKADGARQPSTISRLTPTCIGARRRERLFCKAIPGLRKGEPYQA